MSWNPEKKQEQKYGFGESTTHSNFFRKGTKNQWEAELTNKQIKRIENSFNTLMKKLKYM